MGHTPEPMEMGDDVPHIDDLIDVEGGIDPIGISIMLRAPGEVPEVMDGDLRAIDRGMLKPV